MIAHAAHCRRRRFSQSHEYRATSLADVAQAIDLIGLATARNEHDHIVGRDRAGVTLLRGRIAGLLQWIGVLRKPKVVGANHGDVNSLDLHDHGDGFAHRHGVSSQKLSWRSLLALGISGGLLPCPSALVVMLGAIGLQRVGFGLLLIVVFSLGLASVLIAIGILLVRAGATLERLSHSRFSAFQPLIRALPRLAPVASACVITVAGVIITLRALAAAGLITI